MWTVAEYNLVAIAIALLIGLIVGFWVFRKIRGGGRAAEQVDAAPPAAAVAPAARRQVADGAEGNRITDEMAAAAKDVAGQVLGVDAHPDIPGPLGPPDNLQLMKGVGPKLAAQLQANGIVRYDQLAGLSENAVAFLDERMGPFRGRIVRDRLVEQAHYLARGDTDGFEEKFGKLGG